MRMRKNVSWRHEPIHWWRRLNHNDFRLSHMFDTLPPKKKGQSFQVLFAMRQNTNRDVNRDRQKSNDFSVCIGYPGTRVSDLPYQDPEILQLRYQNPTFLQRTMYVWQNSTYIYEQLHYSRTRVRYTYGVTLTCRQTSQTARSLCGNCIFENSTD